MPIITINLDDLPAIEADIADETTAIDTFAVCAHRFGLARVTINGDTPVEAVTDYVEADPTPPHGIYLPISNLINAVDCPHPGCPGRRGQWCGSPATKATYGPYFTHASRKAAAP